MNDLYEVKDYNATFLWSEVARINHTGNDSNPIGTLVWFKGSSSYLFIPEPYERVLEKWKSQLGIPENREYPDRITSKPYVWWMPGQPETGLQGFVTESERDWFSKGGEGPFRRVKATPGEVVYPQMPVRKSKEGK